MLPLLLLPSFVYCYESVAMLRTESIESLLVNPEAARNLTCCICLSLLNSPLQCKRGHLFCSSCIEQHLRTSQACPECREPLPRKKDDLSRALYAENVVRTLKVYCIYRFRYGNSKGDPLAEDDDGCPEKLLLEHAKAHELECAFRYVLCPNKGCDVQGLRANQLERHRDICDFRFVICPFCECDVVASLLQRHREKECANVPLDCPDCGAKELSRKTFNAHECPARPVPCPFAEAGCKVQPLLKDMETHLVESTVAHMLCVKDAMETMRRRFGRMLNVRDERIGVLEALVRKTDAKMTYTLVW